MKKFTPAAIIAVAVVLAIVSYIVLPDVVVVQITASGGVGSTMPRLLAVLLPLAISVAGALLAMTGKQDREYKNLIVSAVGIACAVLTLIFNR